MSVLLDVKDLNISYGRRGHSTTAVDGIDFQVRAGELVSLVGESGSGKSSSAHAILGLLPATAKVAGSVRFGDQELLDLSERHWRRIRGRRISFIPQDPTSSLNPTKRIGKQIAEAISIHDRTATKAPLQRRVIELLELVGIPNPELRARQYPHELSGGMRQRVLIATALSNEPELIVADEPTSALDVTVQKQILDHIDELRETLGVAVLLITHDLGVASERSDRIVVLSEGKVAESGPASEIVNQPKAAYTRRLLDAVPSLDRPAITANSSLRALEVTPLLRATNLRRSFNGRGSSAAITAVDDVSVEIHRGETLGIVGESGSGKSTLARLLTRLTEVDDGVITFDDDDITHLSGEQLRQLRRRVQLVYQNPFTSIDPRFTIERTIVEPLRAFGIGDARSRHERALELLTQVGLGAEHLDRLPAELSGGQLQRVAIARALANRPDLIILDEAVSALDVSVQAQILDLLVRLQEELSVSYAFISHDLAVIRQISHEVVVMNHGQAVEFGPAERVFNQPQSAYTRALLEAVPNRGRGAPASSVPSTIDSLLQASRA